ncbi:MAG TPA: RtcB family protein [Candidatus Binatia bacterium]|nr:RtcB family protein [Candidatus Binatia bacterium]
MPVKIWADTIEDGARQQLDNIAALPIVHHHVAAMPDVHMGIGAAVGAVIATRHAIIPAAVGVDSGCGMAAVRTSLTAEDLDDAKLQAVFRQIERDVPVGREQHRAPADAQRAAQFRPGLDAILARHPGIVNRKSASDWTCQLGSLGGGNHFIELCLDEQQRVWVLLHSGSRGIGNRIGSHFIAQARERALRMDRHLPDRDLAWLDEGSPQFDDYVAAVGWAQDYARTNREVMLGLVLDALRRHLPPFELTQEAVNCHHNYVQREHHFGADVWLTRKGAIRAGKGELGIIPGSMGAKSYVVRGRGNPDSFESCAHGAGRRMSRGEANRRFTAADVVEQTRGVVCRKDKGVVDEIPGAYKDIGQVMAQQQDLVEVVHTLRQVLCVKG